MGLWPDGLIVSLASLEILGLIYLAIAVSKLRERISRMEGKNEQRDRNHSR